MFFVTEVNHAHWRDAYAQPRDAAAALLGRSPVSCFRAASVSDIERIAVALRARRSNDKPFRFVEIEQDDLDALEICARHTPENGHLDLADVNRSHFDLEIDEVAKLLIKGIQQIAKSARPTPNKIYKL